MVVLPFYLAASGRILSCFTPPSLCGDDRKSLPDHPAQHHTIHPQLSVSHLCLLRRRLHHRDRSRGGWEGHLCIFDQDVGDTGGKRPGERSDDAKGEC